MNINTSKFAAFRNRVGAGLLVAMAAVPAIAQDAPTDAVAGIQSEFDLWKPVVVGLVVGFAVVLWAIKAATLAKPR